MSELILQYYAWLSGLNAWFAPWVTALTDTLNVPLASALLFGLLGATAPCQLSAGAATVAFLARQADEPRQLWTHTLAFIAGKAAVYALVGGTLVLAGLSLDKMAGAVIPVAVFARRAMGPFLIVAGLVMLGWVRWSFNWSDRLAEWLQTKVGKRAGWLPAFALGVAFAFTFCPTLFWLFFGLTLPLAIASPGGVLFPGIFAFGTTLPILFIAALLASGLVNVKGLLQRFRLASVWLQRLAGIVFLLLGVNELILYWLT